MAKFVKKKSWLVKPFTCGLKMAKPVQNKIFYTVKPIPAPTPYPWKHVHDDCIFSTAKLTAKKVSRREHAFTGKGLSQKDNKFNKGVKFKPL